MAVQEKNLPAGATAPAGVTGAASANGVTEGHLVEIKMADSEKKSVTTALPQPVIDALKADATKRDLTDNSVVRAIVAAHYGFKIVDNAVTRIGKYAGLSKEEAKAQRNAENQKKRARMEKIMNAIANGDIPTELLAKLGLDAA